MKYSKKTKGFYPSEPDLLEAYASLPDDLVEISDEDYYKLINNQSGDKTINFDAVIPEVVEVTVTDDFYAQQARKVRDSIRSQIDLFVLPTSTIKDELVTDEQKAILVQDSLVLARWPSTEGWPFIDLPALSELTESIIKLPVWEYSTNIEIQVGV